jgi:hypothetical protein
VGAMGCLNLDFVLGFARKSREMIELDESAGRGGRRSSEGGSHCRFMQELQTRNKSYYCLTNVIPELMALRRSSSNLKNPATEHNSSSSIHILLPGLRWQQEFLSIPVPEARYIILCIRLLFLLWVKIPHSLYLCQSCQNLGKRTPYVPWPPCTAIFPIHGP